MSAMDFGDRQDACFVAEQGQSLQNKDRSCALRIDRPRPLLLAATSGFVTGSHLKPWCWAMAPDRTHMCNIRILLTNSYAVRRTSGREGERGFLFEGHVHCLWQRDVDCLNTLQSGVPVRLTTRALRKGVCACARACGNEVAQMSTFVCLCKNSRVHAQ